MMLKILYEKLRCRYRQKRDGESVLNITKFNHHEIRHAGLSLWLRNN